MKKPIWWKKQIGEITCLWNRKLAKQIGDEMATWQNLQLMKKQVGQTNSWWKTNVMKKQIGEITFLWNSKLAKQIGNKMAA